MSKAVAAGLAQRKWLALPAKVFVALRRRATKTRHRLSLAHRFLVAAALVLIVSMAILGSWVTHQITQSVLNTTGEATGSFLQSFLGPQVQELGEDGILSPTTRAELDDLLEGAAGHHRILSLKVWSPEGRMIYSSSDPATEGRYFESEEVARAARGEIVFSFDEVAAPESTTEQALGMSLIEVYTPLYRSGSQEIIAIGEAYENSEELARQLWLSQLKTWVVVCGTTLVMLSILFEIVRHGSQTITRQRLELQGRLDELQRLASQNEKLRRKAERSRLDANDANEELLARIGQELHDGPIQVLTLVMLRLSQFFADEKSGHSSDGHKMEAILQLTGSSIQELRLLSLGLVLPEIGHLTTVEAVKLAVERHEDLTNSKVHLDLATGIDQVPDALKICLYRIIQEALSNSFRHAGGVAQSVWIWSGAGTLHVIVSDEGQGIGGTSEFAGSGLGLRGIRSRVHAFGGEAEIRSDCSGTQVIARLPLK